MKIILTSSVILMSTSAFSFPVQPSLDVKTKALRGIEQRVDGKKLNSKIACEITRKNRSGSYVNVIFNFKGSAPNKLDMTVLDWSHRSPSVEMTYKNACSHDNNGSVDCKWSDLGSFNFNLNQIDRPVYDSPFGGAKVIGYALRGGHQFQGTMFGLSSRELKCKLYL